MDKKPDSLKYIAVLFGLIVAAVVITSIINAVKSNQGSQTDIRARAGVVNIVKLTGRISGVNTTDGTVTITNVEFTQDTRSGPATNYGTWTVTPPTGFDLNTLVAGKTATFVISSTSLNVATKNVAASQMTVSN